jgi:DNA-binding NarL/FixJ family response regulator
VNSIRTVTITMAPLFRDLVTVLLAGHCSIDLVAEIDNRIAIEQRLQALAPELVLIGLGAGEGDEIGSTLAGSVPGARLIAFSSDNRHAFVHQLHRPRSVLLDFSSQQLVDAALGRDG